MRDRPKSERASAPEDLARLFVQRANAGDVEGLVDLYEPNAVLARTGEEPAVGSAKIRSFYTALLTQRPTFEPGQHQPVLRNGDLALTSSQLANGAVTVEIARRQTDGSWLWIVDQPSIFKPHKIIATPTKRGAAHERLSVFIGKWHAEGDSYAAGQTKADPRGSLEKWISDETYAWLPGHFFVMQTWDAMTGANPFKGTAVISYDAATGAYMTRSYENHGFVRDYVTRVDGDIWTFSGDAERARIEFTDGGKTQEIAWEWRKPGEDWLPLCDRVARRCKNTW